MDYTDIPSEEAGPRAEAMLETLRAMGYTVETAIADILDNSIAAGATLIDIDTVWRGERSTLTITDNGRGMNAEELREAMRPGSRHPAQKRHEDDLGRFGLGLKTASFSQCRRFTVLSRRAGYSVVYRCWDLDYVNQQQAWQLLCHVSDPTLITRLEKQEQGTIVFWEDMDRLTGGLQADDARHEALFGRAMEQVSRHLAMVFHRYMEDGSVQIRVNGHALVPWDPFLSGEQSTQRKSEETLLNGQVTVRTYILPHHRRLSHPDVFEQASGPRGWNAHQGFYIYRNRRLLVPGDWLGLFRRDEHCKLARIMVDLPNTLDEEWQIDIRKAQSRPPAVLRRDLERIGSFARTQASEVYRARGKKLQRTRNLGFIPVWNENVRQGRRHYTINRDHPLLRQVLEQVSGAASSLLQSVLRLVEESVPVPLIAQNEAETPLQQATPYEFVAEHEVAPLLRQLYQDFRAAGQSADEARQLLLLTEPFNFFPELINELN